MDKLVLVKSEKFGVIQCDFYQNEDVICMTINQLWQVLGYANKNGIEKILSRHAYLKQPEFSGTYKMSVPQGNVTSIQATRVFTEDGIYEVTMLAKTEKAKNFRAWVRKVLKGIRSGYVTLPDYIAKDPVMAIRYDQLQMKDQLNSIEEKVQVIETQLNKQQAGDYTAEIVEIQPAPLTDNCRWYTSREIAEMAKVSYQHVGRIALKHGLRTEEFSRTKMTESDGKSRVLKFNQTVYNEAGKDRILALLEKWRSQQKKKRKTRRNGKMLRW